MRLTNATKTWSPCIDPAVDLAVMLADGGEAIADLPVSRKGASTWRGPEVLAHNLVKITTVATA